MREKRTINSFGNITIPKKMRDAIGLDSGISTVQIFLRDDSSGEKEIVIKRLNSYRDILEKYSIWVSVVSRVVACSVGLVWNKKVLSLSSFDNSIDLVDKNVIISSVLGSLIENTEEDYILFKDRVPFLESGDGEVKAVFRIKNTCGEGFVVIVHGTKYDRDDKISVRDMMNRYSIIRDIMSRI